MIKETTQLDHVIPEGLSSEATALTREGWHLRALSLQVAMWAGPGFGEKLGLLLGGREAFTLGGLRSLSGEQAGEALGT